MNLTYENMNSFTCNTALAAIRCLDALELKKVLEYASECLMEIQDKHEKAIRVAIDEACAAGLNVNFTDMRMNNTVTICDDEPKYYVDVE